MSYALALAAADDDEIVTEPHPIVYVGAAGAVVAVCALPWIPIVAGVLLGKRHSTAAAVAGGLAGFALSTAVVYGYIND